MDLFDAQLKSKSHSPLADRMRPTTLDEIVGQDHILGQGKVLRMLIEKDQLRSIIFWGPPGTGKTTFASVIARTRRGTILWKRSSYCQNLRMRMKNEITEAHLI